MSKRYSLDWLTWCSLDSPAIALFILEKLRTQTAHSQAGIADLDDCCKATGFQSRLERKRRRVLMSTKDNSNSASGSITSGKWNRQRNVKAGRQKRKKLCPSTASYMSPKVPPTSRERNAENSWQQHLQDELENEW